MEALYHPPMLARPGEITITPWSYQSIVVPLYCGPAATPGSQNFVTANMAVFYPFGVPEAMLVTQLFWMNGAAVAGNLDAGIYNTSGTLLTSTGSTTQVNTAVVQAVNITDYILPRGLYYFALASDTSDATQKVLCTIPVAGFAQSFGLLQQATAFPLATNANPAVFAKYTSAFVPQAGLVGYRALAP